MHYFVAFVRCTRVVDKRKTTIVLLNPLSVSFERVEVGTRVGKAVEEENLWKSNFTPNNA
jgi:hypothetical protein